MAKLELKCPECGAVIPVDEAEAAGIIKQVRDAEFNKELDEYKKHLEKEKASELDLQKKEYEALIKDAQNQGKEEAAKLQSLIDKAETEKQMAVNDAVAEKEKEILSLKAAAEKAEADSKLAVSNAVAEKEKEILGLKSTIEKADTEKQLAVSTAVAEKDKELLALQSDIKDIQNKNEVALLNQKTQLEAEFKEKLGKVNEELEQSKREVEHYRDLKQSMSTKAIGEQLELHCERQYNMILRPVIPEAYFEKDNEISETGSKGDYIFREMKDGVELLSIMFEMKNEMETTETKKTNEYYMKELDKDRREKGCEYAVLVSMLETDNEYYNQGIVDVSYRYPKMYVIRPQFLVPIITILRNAALNAYQYRKKVADYEAEHIDVTNFQNKLDTFKKGFTRNCELSVKRFEDAIKSLEKVEKDIKEAKEGLMVAEKHLVEAGNKLDDLTIRKLVYGNPTMKKLFAEAAAAEAAVIDVPEDEVKDAE